MSEAKALLGALPYWKELTECQRQELEAAAFLRRYEAGEMIYRAGDDFLGMVTILTGEVRAYIVSEEGREVTLYRLTDGELGVLSETCAISHITFETYLEAVRETELLIIPSKVYDDLAEQNLHVRCFTYELTAQRFAVIMWVMQQILFARFDQRLASFLLEECRRTGSREIIMTQEQIAGYVNSAREVVARMLKRFAAEGLIENRRGSLELIDLKALKRIAGDSTFPEEFMSSSVANATRSQTQ